jgi:tetratricopeptide (TPR) repeat protein
MKTSKIFYTLLTVALISSCGLENMASKYNTVDFTTKPETLEVHGGNVALSLDAKFAEKYFVKKATVDFTPVLVFDGGEMAFKTITVQGEESTGGEATIFHATGGDFKYKDVISYSEEMKNSRLELRAIAKVKDKEKILGPVTIANGVIATSKRVQNNEKLANNNHGYEKETILEETATIYFLVNKSNVRNTEKSDEDIQSLKIFAAKGFKTHSIEIISYASPEGSVNLNDNVSEKRMKSTFVYTKRLLKSLKVDGANNNDLYVQSSVGEDWSGFEKLIQDSEIKDKRRINKIVNSISNVDVREQQIRDLAEIYSAIENDVLPQLRKATIIIRSFEPKRSDEEIKTLSTTSPETLNVKELLFSATLSEDEVNKEKILTKVVDLHKDWRGYNNIACMHIAKGNLETAMSYLNKAESLDRENSDIATNKGIIAARIGELANAQVLFNKANTSEINQAILNIRKGEYKKAVRFFKNEKTHNATLAKLLDGSNNVTCNEESAACYYLNAISAARLDNSESVIHNLTEAISKDISYKKEALNDMEFFKLRSEIPFIELTK